MKKNNVIHQVHVIISFIKGTTIGVLMHDLKCIATRPIPNLTINALPNINLRAMNEIGTYKPCQVTQFIKNEENIFHN